MRTQIPSQSAVPVPMGGPTRRPHVATNAALKRMIKASEDTRNIMMIQTLPLLI
jgi:hypothetical protein